MTTQRLKTEEILRAMRDRGLSQSSIAARLDVSREAVSKWMKGNAFPRPRVLLEMSRLLDLGFSQLVAEDAMTRPMVAFRKHGRSTLTDEHFNRAMGMGYMLRNLVEYLPYDTLSKPSSLISPRLEYDYIVKAAAEVRKRMRLTNNVVDFTDLIDFFENLHAILIPVLWGKKKLHENAMHVYLPDSQTTWIFLNLDAQIVDFKFWMAHELGHVKAPNLDPEEAEEFSDAFAAEVLFPHQFAELEYDDIARLVDKGAMVNRIKRCAFQYMVSPVTLYKQINSVGQRSGKGDLGLDIFPAASNFGKEFRTVSETLFGTDTPTASDYLRISSKAFRTKIFEAIREFIRDKRKGPGFIQKTLDIPVIDSKEIHKVLVSDVQ
jgi:transcriptional regulator with XRE-family HTH domain